MTPADLAAAVLAAVRAAVDDGEIVARPPASVTVERPKHPDHGDYSSNVAMQLARTAGRPPRALAELLAARLRTVPGVQAVEVAGPGFLNFRVTSAALGEIARTVVTQAGAYGSSTVGDGQRLNLEFVSSNPTGPVHIGAVRWAAVGDALARLLQATGASVTREYYFNDAGVQIDRFAESLLASLLGRPVPDEGYAGAYIAEIAGRVAHDHPGLAGEPEEKVLEVLRRDGVERMLADIRRSLDEFGVHFDVYFSERGLHDSGAIEAAVRTLREKGHVYEADGAVWLRTTDFGDDKDRVLVKSDGSTTYFAADVAYYLDKRARGFDKVVIMLGADHHGYLGRMRAMVACAGEDPDARLEILIGQMVNLVRNGEVVRMSKRAGTFVTLEDLVEAVGVDAARYSLARASVDSPLDLDVDLLTRQVNENPVFYVQYAHARIASLLRNAGEIGLEASATGFDPALLATERETALLGSLGEFPRVVATAAELREPHRVARYLEALAGTYHRFYDSCRVLPMGDEPATPVTTARLLLCAATRVVLANGLHLLGVSAPDRM